MIVDLFAGPGGWELAARELGLTVLGVELDAQTCATRRAAGLLTLQADVAAADPRAVCAEDVVGLIASPPCQAFSAAGSRAGVRDADVIADVIADLERGVDARHRADELVDAPGALFGFACADRRAILVVEPLRWALALRPAWIALEQVPAVLPIWHAIAAALGRHGWQTATAVVNAADYGVPQTRERAVLLAHRDRPVAIPSPTHAGAWVSMRDVLGWDADERVGFPRLNDRVTDGQASVASPDGRYRGRDLRRATEPAFTVTEKARSWTRLRTGQESRLGGGRTRRYDRATDRPAPTLTSTARSGWHWTDEGERRPVTLGEAAVLQTFPADYPWQGSRSAAFLQLANAIPPRLARALLEVVAIGVDE